LPKANMNDMLKRRMAATQQASELQTSDEAYQQTVDTLCTWQKLQNQNLGKLSRILCYNACCCLTCDCNAHCRTDACQKCCNCCY